MKRTTFSYSVGLGRCWCFSRVVLLDQRDDHHIGATQSASEVGINRVETEDTYSVGGWIGGTVLPRPHGLDRQPRSYATSPHGGRRNTEERCHFWEGEGQCAYQRPRWLWRVVGTRIVFPTAWLKLAGWDSARQSVLYISTRPHYKSLH